MLASELPETHGIRYPGPKKGEDWERLKIEGEFHGAGKRILGLLQGQRQDS